MPSLSPSQNSFTGAAALTETARLTPGEVELVARRLRAAIIADGLASLIVATCRAIGWLARPIAAWWSRTQVYDELMSMDDRMLDDIGISRADIPAVAAGGYRADTNGVGWHAADRVRRMPRPSIPAADNDRAASPQVA